MASIGFNHFWGFTPSINFFRGIDSSKQPSLDLQDTSKPINILLSKCADVRHVLKSISDTIEPPAHEDLTCLSPQKEVNVSAFTPLIPFRSISTRNRLKFSAETSSFYT
jgi:hypothetical protein